MEEPPFPILFRDERFIVIDKPAGLAVHAGRAGGRSVEDYFPLFSRRRTGPWLAHRLDRDTSGCLVVALRRAALLEAQALFAAGAVRKTYWAIVQGRPIGDSGRVAIGLSKQTDQKAWRMVEDPGGSKSVSDWRLMGHAGGMSWLQVEPHTGRTHQVRVHCAWLGCPIVGDAVYGVAGGTPLQLLARAIEVPVQPTVVATARPGGHMAAGLRMLGWAD